MSVPLTSCVYSGDYKYYSITVFCITSPPWPPPTLDPKQFPDATFCADFFFRQEIRRGKPFTFDGSCSKAPEVFVPSFVHCVSASFRRHAGFCLIKAAARQPFRRTISVHKWHFMLALARSRQLRVLGSSQKVTVYRGDTRGSVTGEVSPSSLRSVSYKIW